MATRKYAYCQEPSKIILLLTAQRICAIGSGKDKNSCRSFAKLSAWYFSVEKLKIIRVILSLSKDLA